ncbi:MAG: M81 family metallopeptidase [Verrucomicrobiae bacterium]|nr:M81 family metallopeptidase [Verrucomicrobiae bacterium]
MLRIGIVGLLQESNTFIEARTTRRHFQEDLLLRGEAIREAMAGAPHEVGGFFEELGKVGSEVVAVPLFLARALPYGVIDRGAFEELVGELLESVAGAGHLDGILAAPHGATVAEGHPDADGYWLGALRRAIGAEMPVIATLDPHANLSPEMVAATTALVAYCTNPHLDQRETGRRAARLLLDTLRGEIRPVQAAVFPSMAINIRVQNTSEPPLSLFCEEAAILASKEGILSHSLLFGFPYADVAEMGSSVLVVADGDPVLARDTAAAMASRMWERREEFEPVQLDVGASLAEARSREARPVVLLDMGDNVGGGSPADSTAIVQAWFREGAEGRLFICLHDPSVVRAAVAAGTGGVIEGRVGDSREPVVGNFRVRSLHEGTFFESEARHGGFSVFDQGQTAVLEREGTGLVILATSLRMAPFSLAQLTSCGLDPTEFDWIVAKGVIAPMAAYAPVARGGFVHVDSPGVTRADMTKLDYVYRRRPMFPFKR